eukprot:g22151.t1
MKLRRSSWLARAAVLFAAAATWVLGQNWLFVGPFSTSLAPPANPAQRGQSVSRYAREKKGFDPNWKRPFPKYILMGGVMMTLIGYLGGGPILSAVWGLCGAGFGCLFEPWQTPDGTISGLYDEDEEDEDEDDDDD